MAKVEGSVAEPVRATKIIFIHGDKGGVGKSMVAQALGDYLSAKGEKLAILEADTQNPDVSRMFNQSAPCAQTNLRNDNGWMDVMDFVMKHKGHHIIINTPAGIGQYMKDDMGSFASFLSEQSYPIELELWWVMNVQHDSVNLLNEALKAYGEYFNRLRVVCNLHFANGDRSKDGPFLLWHESPLKAKIEKADGMTLYLPGLHLRVVSKLFAPEKMLPFSDAVDVGLGETVGLGDSERWKLSAWIKECWREFDRALQSVSST